MDLSAQIGKTLTRRKKTISIAESCSGGLLGHELTNIPGSSAYFKGGVIAYSNNTKTKFLRIPPALIKKHGAVSEAVAIAMAQKVRALFRSDYGVSITGIAGPGGGTNTKPVGLTYIAVAGRSATQAAQFIFKGSRLQVKSSAVQTALQLLRRQLSK